MFDELAEKVTAIALNFGSGALDDHLLRSTVDEVILGMPTPPVLMDEILTLARAKITARFFDAN